MCRDCHEAITNRIRGEKYANGWRDIDTMSYINTLERKKDDRVIPKEKIETPKFLANKNVREDVVVSNRRVRPEEAKPFVSEFVKTR